MSKRYELHFIFSEDLWQPTSQILEDFFDEEVIQILIESAIDGSQYQGLREGYQKGIALHDANQAENMLRFTWKLNKAFEKEIKVQLEFEDPYRVSSTAYG